MTVLRRGVVVGQCSIPCANEKLVEFMFGQVLERTERPAITLGEPALELRGVSVSGGRVRVAGLDLQVQRAEVIGLAGLEGSGQELVLRVCAGLLQPEAGTVRLAGQDMTGRPYRRFLQTGVAFLPAGRLEEGLVPGLDLREHAVLAQRSGARLVDWQAAQAMAEGCIRDFDIRGRPDSRVEELSGGNQQRALLALLPASLALLLMEHPTRGLDMESAMWVWSKLLERRQSGTAIVFSSSDLDEVIERSDRILVFCGGGVTRALPASSTSAAQLGEMIGGLGQESAQEVGVAWRLSIRPGDRSLQRWSRWGWRCS